MSLYGNYIAEMQTATGAASATTAPEIDAADAFYEAAMKNNSPFYDYEYYRNILESSVNELASFESTFIDEFAFINEAESKEKFGKFKELVKKFIGMVTGLIEHVKKIFNKIKESLNDIKNKKFAKRNREAIKLIEDKGAAAAVPAIEDKGGKEEEKKPEKAIDIKHKTGGSSFKAELSKKAASYKLYKLAPKFIDAINKFDSVKVLKLNFGYGENSAMRTKGADSKANNSYFMNFVILHKGIEGCTTLESGSSALDAEQKFEAIQAEMAKLVPTAQKISVYLTEARSLAKHVDEMSIDKYNKAMNNSKSADNQESYDQAQINFHDMHADFMTLQRYVGFLSKACEIFFTAYEHNAQEYTKFTGLLEMYKRKVQAA